jgi:hypothetical protein
MPVRCRHTLWRPGCARRFACQVFRDISCQGAQTIVYLASSPDVAKMTGRYFYQSVPAKPSPEAQDDQAALLLWQRSATMAGMEEWP